MAVQFHPLPTDVFQEDARPYIARLNRELRDLFGLEGVIRNPIATRRSDNSITRRSTVQVDVSRITPSITTVVSGSSTVVGTPSLTLGTVNTIGTTSSALSTNSTIALFGTQAPVGYSTAGAVGTSAFAARADFILPFPEALGTTSDRSQRIVFTSAGAGSAELTVTGIASGGGTDALVISAPNATDAVRVGTLGNMGFGGTTPTEETMWNINKLDIAGNTTGYRGLNANFTQAGKGDANIGSLILVDMTATASASGISVSNTLFGVNIGLAGGVATNGNFTGAVRGMVMAVKTARLNAGSCGDQICYDAFGTFQTTWTSTSVRANMDQQVGFRCSAPNNTGGGVTVNMIGYQQLAFIQGTSRIGYQSRGMNTGSPTLSCNFQALLHSVGTTRRSYYGENSAEILKDLILGRTTFGVVYVDTQATPEYWRMSVDSTGLKDATLSIDATGVVTGTRGTSATGTVTLTVADAGTTAPSV